MLRLVHCRSKSPYLMLWDPSVWPNYLLTHSPRPFTSRSSYHSYKAVRLFSGLRYKVIRSHRKPWYFSFFSVRLSRVTSGNQLLLDALPISLTYPGKAELRCLCSGNLYGGGVRRATSSAIQTRSFSWRHLAGSTLPTLQGWLYICHYFIHGYTRELNQFWI